MPKVLGRMGPKKCDGKIPPYGIAGLNSANFTQCRLSRRDSAFSYIEFCKVGPGSRMITV